MDLSLKSIMHALEIHSLRLRINSYSRQLHSIRAQRDNDFNLECVLHREMSIAESCLKQLELQSLARPPVTGSAQSKRDRSGT